MAGQDHWAVADLDAKAVQEGLRSTRHHHAGAIVAVKHHRAFNRALGQNDLACPDPPKPFTRGIGGNIRQMVGQLLAQTQHVLVVVANRRGPVHQPHVWHAHQFGQSSSEPVPRRLAFDHRRGFGQKRATHLGLLIHHGDQSPGACGGQRGGKARGACPHDKHIAVQIAAGVMVGVKFGRRPAKTGGAADEGLIDLVPEGLGPHEGLVVEARRKQHIEPVVDRAEVEFQTGPLVLAFRRQTAVDLLHGGAGVGFKPAWPTTGADQGVRLFGPCSHHATRTVVFEAAPHEVFAIGQQSRGDGIAFKA